MLRPALVAVSLAAILLGPAAAQESPFAMPKPVGGPIVDRSGKVLTGLDAHPVPSPWTSALDFGLSGSQGNTETMKLRTGFDVRYDSPDDFFLLNALYILNMNQQQEIENKAFLLTRNELPLDWGLAWYVQGQLEYDAFRTVYFRVASHSGVSFAAIQDGSQVFKVRAGVGTDYELGLPTPGQWVPEGQAGIDYEYKLTANTRFTSSADWYPDLHNIGHYRVRVRVSFDIMIDPDLNLLLRIGAFDRFDSQPYGSKRNDLDYFATMQIRF